MGWFFQVRIKPQMSKFEVDLVIDTDSENYDQDREEHLQISTQVSHFSVGDLFHLLEQWKYSLGWLAGCAVMQLEMSMVN